MNAFRRLKRFFRNRPITQARVRGLHVEALECRVNPATYAYDAGNNTLLIELANNESLTVTQSGNDFNFTLSTGTFTQAGTDTATGDGTATITIADADLASSVAIQNTTATTGTNDVTFDGTGNLTSATISVNVTDADTVNTITLSNSFDLTTSSSVSLMTTESIVIGSGSIVTNGTAAGTLAANQQATPTTGDFIGIDNAGTITTTSGLLTLQGRGGDAATNQDGVRNSGTISSSGTGSVSITGTTNAAIATGSEGFSQTSTGTINTSAGTGDVTLIADSVDLNASSTINAGTNDVTIVPFTGLYDIDVGGADTATVLGLTNTELGTITAQGLLIGNTNTGTITVSAPVTLTTVTEFAVTTDTAGSVVFNNSLAVNGTNTLVAISTGTISSPGGATSDVTADLLAIISPNGIGTSTNPLTTSVSNLEAQTTAGNIFVSNSGLALAIGGVTSALSGVTVTTTGTISLSNDNDISIILNGEVVAGPNTISIAATGTGSDIVTGGNNATSAVSFGAVESSGGAVSLNAGQDLLLGTSANGFGDVVGVGVTLSAGRHVVVDAQTDVLSTGAGNVSVTAGTAGGVGDVSILKNNANGASIITSGGTLSITTAPGGTLTLDSDTTLAGGPLTLDTTFGGGNGNITVNADRVNISANDAVTAGTAIVTIQQVTTDWNIDLGSAVDNTATTLELADAELDRVTAGVLRIGDPANTGDINVSSAISPANTTTLHLRTGGAITDTNTTGADITITNLALTTASGIGSADDLDTAVTNLAATNSTANSIVIENSSLINVTTVDGVTGLSNTASGLGLQLSTTSGSITVVNTAATNDVSAAGNGTINLLAADDLTINSNAQIVSGSGTISLFSNFDNTGTDEDVSLGANVIVQTNGDVQINADPNVDGTGGGLVFGSGVSIQSNLGGAVANLTLVAAEDLVLGAFAATTTFSATSTGGNILDDAVDSTVVAATNITLTAAGRVGGSGTIDPGEVIGQNGDFLDAIDVDLQGGTLTVAQTGAGGNIQLRETSGTFAISSLNLSGAVLSSGNQLALIGSGGALNVDTAVSLAAGINTDLLLATTGNNSITFSATINNGGSTATTNAVATGGTTASISGPTTDGAAELVGANIGLFTTGGLVGSLANPLEIDAGTLNGFTTGNSAAGGAATVTDTTGGLSVGQFDAGTANVVLSSAGGPIVSVTPNDNIAEILGNMITVDTTAAPSNTTVGQIGSFAGTPQFFEVDASILVARTNNSRLWIRDVSGGVTVEALDAGTENPTLDVAGMAANLVLGTANSTGQVVNSGGTTRLSATGSITSAAPTNVFDVVGATLIVGTATQVGVTGTPLETDIDTLQATSGTGGVFVTNTGALALNNVSATGTGDIVITTVDTTATGENLTVNASQTVSAVDGNVSLQAGDNLTVNGTVSNTGAGLLTLAGDFGNADAGTGSTVTIATGGAVTPVISTTLVTGGTDADTFVLDLTSLTAATLLIDGANAGTFSFGNHTEIAYTGIDSIDTTNGTYTLTLDMANAGFQDSNASPDVTALVVTMGTLNITVQSNSTGSPASVFSGEAADVTTFSFVGSTDRDSVSIDPTNLLIPTNVQGGNPTTAPGDSLAVNLTGLAGTLFTPGMTAGTGTFTFTNTNTITFAGIEMVATPVITIVANDATGAETAADVSANAGQFTLTRLGDTSASLVVNVIVTGTATNGLDFVTIPTTVTFNAGSATATIDVTVLNDSSLESAETVTVTIAPGTGYAPDVGGIATVTINDNDVVSRQFVVGLPSGGGIVVFDNGGNPVRSITPFPGFAGRTAVATGDVNGDGVADVIAIPGSPGAAIVRIYDGVTGAERLSFLAVPAQFTLGWSITVADVNGDGRGEIIVGAQSFASYVGVFDGMTGTKTGEFFAFGSASVGVNVSAGDLNGDGSAEIVVGAVSVAPFIAVFSGSGAQLTSFFAFNPAIALVGVTVTVGDFDGNGMSEIVAGVNLSTGNFALRYDASNTLSQIISLPPATTPGVGLPLATSDVTGDGLDDLLVSINGLTGVFAGPSLTLSLILPAMTAMPGASTLG